MMVIDGRMLHVTDLISRSADIDDPSRKFRRDDQDTSGWSSEALEAVHSGLRSPALPDGRITAASSSARKTHANGFPLFIRAPDRQRRSTIPT